MRKVLQAVADGIEVVAAAIVAAINWVLGLILFAVLMALCITCYVCAFLALVAPILAHLMPDRVLKAYPRAYACIFLGFIGSVLGLWAFAFLEERRKRRK
jgi:MFS family permease